MNLREMSQIENNCTSGGGSNLDRTVRTECRPATFVDFYNDYCSRIPFCYDSLITRAKVAIASSLDASLNMLPFVDKIEVCCIVQQFGERPGSYEVRGPCYGKKPS